MQQTSPQPPFEGAKPVAGFPKQAIVVIHGMGEQKPMDTIKGFVRAVWVTDQSVLQAAAVPGQNPAEIWSKPDVRTGSLELRRITTRQSAETLTFPKGVRCDFYELYWADLSGGSTWANVRNWIIVGLLLRDPRTQVPRNVLVPWILLWFVTVIVVMLTIATVLPKEATLGPWKLWEVWPLSWLAVLEGWQLAAIAAVLALIARALIVPYFGRVVRYTRAKPENIEARKNIRERGLALLKDLHDTGEYERIIVVGHSLGSIVAYELISYFWAARAASHTLKEGSDAFKALCAVERASSDLDRTRTPAAIRTFLEAQRYFCRSLRLPKPQPQPHDTRWLITDLITVGSPLTHTEFLLARNKEDLHTRKDEREFPTSPPVRELLHPDLFARARAAGLPVADETRLFCFPFGKDAWQLHHAAPFAAVRWTNIFDPSLLVYLGDIISGPVSQIFGPGVIDVNLKSLRGQAYVFTHTLYWSLESVAGSQEHLRVLREAVDLSGRSQP